MLFEKMIDGYIKPTKIFGNLYFVGCHPASSHLIDTGAGLILIDPGYMEGLYLLIQNIWEIGFNPKDIKYIVLSHAHFDHMDATKVLVKMTGAKTFIEKADLPLLTGEIYHYPIRPFTPDCLLEDGDIISLGNTNIKCVSTPGHTEGTMSFFFDVTDGEKTYRAGMHGGVGVNTMEAAFLNEHGFSFDIRETYFRSLDKVENEKVDIFIGNHVWNNDTKGKIEKLATSAENPFIDPDEWKNFIINCHERFKKFIEDEKNGNN